MKNMMVSYAPHVRERVTVNRIMLDVLIALAPSCLTAMVVFGWRAGVIIAVCVGSCMLFEGAYQKLVHKPVTINDFSAAVTGMLLAFNLPVEIPLWQAVFGCAVAVIIVKQLFGGLGKNFANPAITARVVMFIAFSTSMTTWVAIPDAVSSATPLMLMKRGDFVSLPVLADMLFGMRGGCIGETNAFALLVGGVYLLYRRVITWHTPVAFIGTVFALTALWGAQPLHHIMAGGLVLGAFFMATDYPTTPQTSAGRVLFGLGCGLITSVIRLYGSYPEGVAFSILFMNMLTPYINKITMKKALGGKYGEK